MIKNLFVKWNATLYLIYAMIKMYCVLHETSVNEKLLCVSLFFAHAYCTQYNQSYTYMHVYK